MMRETIELLSVRCVITIDLNTFPGMVSHMHDRLRGIDGDPKTLRKVQPKFRNLLFHDGQRIDRVHIGVRGSNRVHAWVIK